MLSFYLHHDYTTKILLRKAEIYGLQDTNKFRPSANTEHVLVEVNE